MKRYVKPKVKLIEFPDLEPMTLSTEYIEDVFD